MTLADLTPEDLDSAIRHAVDDLCDVARHVLEHPADFPALGNPTMAALIDSLRRREVPEPQPVLANVVAWVLFMLRWHARHRRLTEAERAVEAAAWRLSDAIHGPRHH